MQVFRGTILSFLIASGALFVAQSVQSQPSIGAASFEEGVFPVLGKPSAELGNWAGEHVAYLVPSGVDAHEGSRVMQFKWASAGVEEATNNASCAVFQLVDLAPVIDEVQAGDARIRVSAWFTRVHLDSQTDTRFRVALYFPPGNMSNFPNVTPLGSLEPPFRVDEMLLSDSLIETWEVVDFVASVPASATYVAVGLIAGENVHNDTVPPNLEFDGHYCDDVSFQFLTGPIGDLGDDGMVGGADLAVLLASWGTCPTCPADLNADGTVDGADLAALLANWTP